MLKIFKKLNLNDTNSRIYLFTAIGVIVLAFLMLFRLGSIMPGITSGEHSLFYLKAGWHGIYRTPINLPMNLLWSIDFKLLSPVSNFLLRLPSALAGAVSVVAFFLLLKTWHGIRTALIGTVLFATSAWTLHVSRLADYNVEFLAAMTVFLLTAAALQKKFNQKYIYWLINFAWGLLLFVPGMVFFIAYNIFRQREEIGFGMKKQTNFLSKLVYVLASLIWLPLLIRYLIRSTGNIKTWLGFPSHLPTPQHFIKEFGAVFYHLFLKGPLLPNLWLARVPILDIFTTITCLIGAYFYVTHIKATRTHLLFVSLLIGLLLIALGGSVTISLIMPIIYIFVAAGVAYLLSQWLSTFPENPIARTLGYILIALAVAASVTYNLKSYYIAWPHNDSSVSVFDVKNKD